MKLPILSNLFKANSEPLIGTVVLVSLDGWGLAPPSKGNAISQAKTPTMDYLYQNYPHGELIASGESVGLPATEVGNSEVGHLTMGVGRVIYQSLKRINISIENGSFYDNEAFESAVKHVSQNKSKLHLVGLIGSGNVHSNTDHLYALLQFCKKSMLANVCLHLFTDGRDAPPNEGKDIIAQIDARVKTMGVGSIATVSGRYYAMDRDGRWERIELAYNAIITGSGRQAKSATEAIEKSYQEGKTDEFVEPTVILSEGEPKIVEDNDAVIFFNFRVDRARELTMAFVLPDFESTDMSKYDLPGIPFKRTKVARNLHFVTMTQYLAGLPVNAVAFPPQFNFPDSLPEIFSKHNIRNLHLAESEKERMVTYYFRGMNSAPFALEDVVIVPSPKVATYDVKPEMAAWQVLNELKRALNKNIYGFVVVNFANPDMVAHSGKIEPTIKAIEIVDKVIKELIDIVLERNGVIIISADHGNAEELVSYPNQSFYYTTDQGVKNTDHSSNPVPLIIVSKSLKGKADIRFSGTLADIAPTILAIMKLDIPGTMQGRNLMEQSHA